MLVPGTPITQRNDCTSAFHIIVPHPAGLAGSRTLNIGARDGLGARMTSNQVTLTCTPNTAVCGNGKVELGRGVRRRQPRRLRRLHADVPPRTMRRRHRRVWRGVRRRPGQRNARQQVHVHLHRGGPGAPHSGRGLQPHRLPAGDLRRHADPDAQSRRDAGQEAGLCRRRSDLRLRSRPRELPVPRLALLRGRRHSHHVCRRLGGEHRGAQTEPEGPGSPGGAAPGAPATPGSVYPAAPGGRALHPTAERRGDNRQDAKLSLRMGDPLGARDSDSLQFKCERPAD